jgi:putative transcriptional regulator
MNYNEKNNYQYTECGLDNVYLIGGVQYVQGPRGRQIVIQDIEGLHRAIGKALLDKRDLTGKELRFLRSEMLMSQATLAKLLEVAEQTVHRWETGKTEVPKPAEALIRLLYAEHLGEEDELGVKASLKRIAELEDEIDRKLTLTVTRGTWEPEARRAA